MVSEKKPTKEELQAMSSPFYTFQQGQSGLVKKPTLASGPVAPPRSESFFEQSRQKYAEAEKYNRPNLGALRTFKKLQSEAYALHQQGKKFETEEKAGFNDQKLQELTNSDSEYTPAQLENMTPGQKLRQKGLEMLKLRDKYRDAGLPYEVWGPMGAGGEELVKRGKAEATGEIAGKEQFLAEAKKRGESAATQAEQANMQQQEIRASQARLIQQLEDRISGKTPSIAEAQLKATQERSLAQQLATAGAARGGSAASLQRALAQQQGATGQQLAQEGGLLRMQELAQNQQQLGGVLSGVRSQDLAVQQNAQALTQSYMQQGFTAQQAEQLARLDLEKARMGISSNEAINAAKLNAANAEAEKTRQQQLFGSLLGAGATLGSAAFAASDINTKENVKSGTKSIDTFLNALKAVDYNYKQESRKKIPELTRDGQQTGIIAQDLEKTSIGKRFVKKLEDGTRIVDYAQGFGAILAAQARLNDRLNKLDKKKKK